MKSHAAGKKKTIVFVSFLGAMAGLLFGLDTGVISGALAFITHEFSLSEAEAGFVVSSLMLGAALGALFAGWLSWKIGRKYCLIVAAVLFIITSVLCGIAPNFLFLIGARIMLGVAIGIASYAAPLYLSEVAPEKVRGAVISLYQLLITVGLLAAFVSDTVLSYYSAWRWMLGIVAIPACLMLIGALILPRSPRWLASKNRRAEAKQVLDEIRDTPQEAETELREIEDSLKIKQSGWQLFQENSNFRRSVGLGVLLQIMQQCTGINIVLYFAPTIIGYAGFETIEQKMWGSVAVGLINVLATFIAIGIVDRWGRRPTLILGAVIMALSMALVGFMFYTNTVGEGVATGLSVGSFVAVLAILVFITGFAMSSGPLTWILCSEIQPLKGRDFGITVSTMTNWLANMVLAATFLILIKELGEANTFWLYALLNALFIFVIIRFVPETKEISLEKIEANLMAGKKLRDIGQPLRG